MHGDFVKEIEKVAAIARLELNEKEKSKFASDLQSILAAFASLDKAKVDKLAPAFHPVEQKNVLRDDKVEASLSQKEALANAPEENKEKGFFKGPRVV